MEKYLQMAIYNTYVQQLSYDGLQYTKGSVVDLLSDYHIVAQEFPFAKNPKTKDLPTRDWAGDDGLDVYVPKEMPVKHYDIEVAFLYTGTEETIRGDISAFIDFLYGRNDGAVGSRLAIYNEHTGIGRKDVVVSEVDNEIFYLTDEDPDAVAKFKVKFTVYDPTTEVTPTYRTVSGVRSVSELNFE